MAFQLMCLLEVKILSFYGIYFSYGSFVELVKYTIGKGFT